MTRIRYLGVSAFEIVTGDGVRVDPYLTGNPLCPIRAGRRARRLAVTSCLIPAAPAHFRRLLSRGISDIMKYGIEF